MALAMAPVAAVSTAAWSVCQLLPPAWPLSAAVTGAPPVGVTLAVSVSVVVASLCRWITRTTALLSTEPAGIADGGANPLTVNAPLSFFLVLFQLAYVVPSAVARLPVVAVV